MFSVHAEWQEGILKDAQEEIGRDETAQEEVTVSELQQSSTIPTDAYQ